MIANTILQQLGGHGFTVMTGSRNYINLGNGLQMSLARNRTSANRLKIILDEDTDTYTMYFYRQTLTKYADIRVKEIAKYEGVYFDMLQQIFTDVTGLYTPVSNISSEDFALKRDVFNRGICGFEGIFNCGAIGRNSHHATTRGDDITPSSLRTSMEGNNV